MKSTRRLIILGTFGLALSACDSGTVGVQWAATPPSPQVAQSTASDPAGTSTERRSAPGADVPGASNPEDASAWAKTLFFVTKDADVGNSPIALDFLSADAQAVSPFYFHLDDQPGHTVSYWKPVILGGKEQIAWIGQSDQDSFLEILDPASMKSRQVDPLAAARTRDLAFDASQLAGIDDDGTLFVQRLGFGSKRKSNGGGGEFSQISQGGKDELGLVAGRGGWSRNARVQWFNGSTELAVVDSSLGKVEVFSALDLLHPKLSFPCENFSASPSGKTLLVFSDGRLSRVKLTGNQKEGSYALERLPARISSFIDPRWNGETEVAFVDASQSSVQVDVVELKSGDLAAQYPVSASEDQVGSICPAWAGSRLFYAGEDDSNSWAIWEGDGSGDSERRSFAVPRDGSQGYFCPKGVSE